MRQKNPDNMIKKDNPKNENIRVRYAPSPTGTLHIGGARTALFNYLFARKHQGNFILRIEDTDRKRSKADFEKDVLENLQWLGILWDEGPAHISQREMWEIRNPKSEIRNYRDKKYIGGFGPYRQNERLAVYKKYINKLLTEDKAFFCFCSPEELKNIREYQIREGQPPRYPGKCRQLSKEEIEKKLKEEKSVIVRFKNWPQKVRFQDLIRGKLEFDAALIGDFSLAKKMGEEIFPLYNFAAAIDDYEMKISHVIRGEDHLSNTPKQILIQKALGFPQPKYAHLPLILGTDKSKLSKRHGAVAVASYRKEGYLPEALINFIALLGWNPGTEREIFSLSSLLKDFSLERVQKSGAIFNIQKLDFLNGFYIRQKPVPKLTELCVPYLIKEKLIAPILEVGQYPPAYGGENLIQSYKIPALQESISFEYLQKIIALYQERLKKLSEICGLVDFFFKEKVDYGKSLLVWKEMTDKEVKKVLKRLFKVLSKIEPREWDKTNLEQILIKEAEVFALVARQAGYGVKDRGYLLWPFRVALTGKKASAPPFDIAEILGKEKTLKRVKEALEKL